MSNRHIIVIGASAGGVEALTQLIRHLPQNLPAAVFVTVHFPSSGVSMLPDILSRAGLLPASHAKDNEVIQPGRIYVAPPDHHLLIHPELIRLTRGPKENSCRPAIDPLFRTAAKAYGQQVIGVILSGMLDDGTAGLAVIKQRGGIAFVQDPEDALFSGMPRSAIAHVEIDHVLKIVNMTSVLVERIYDTVEAEGNPVGC